MYMLRLHLMHEQERSERPEASEVLGEHLHVHGLRTGVPRRPGLPRLPPRPPVPERHLLPEVPESDEAPSGSQANVLRVPVLRAPGVSAERHNLPGLRYLAPALVPRDVPHG